MYLLKFGSKYFTPMHRHVIYYWPKLIAYFACSLFRQERWRGDQIFVSRGLLRRAGSTKNRFSHCQRDCEYKISGMSYARQRVSIHNDAEKSIKLLFPRIKINIPSGHYLRILFLPFRSFLQLVGDLDELKKKDYPEITKPMQRLPLGTEVSKGNTCIWFLILYEESVFTMS